MTSSLDRLVRPRKDPLQVQFISQKNKKQVHSIGVAALDRFPSRRDVQEVMPLFQPATTILRYIILIICQLYFLILTFLCFLFLLF